MNLKSFLSVVVASILSFGVDTQANASIIVADKIITFFDSGAGPMPGPYGGTYPGTFPVSVPLSYATDGNSTTFVSLPTGSYITLGFSAGFVFDGPGRDLFVSEIGGNDETANIFISSDFGSTFTFLGKATTDTSTGFDLATIGYTGKVNAVKIVGLDSFGSSPGFDLAFVQGFEGSIVIPSYGLTVTKSGTGSGTVTSNTGGINCGSTCSASLSGSAILTATPASDSHFVGWSGACTGTGSCAVTMNAAKSVTATFKPKPFVASTTSNITATSATISTMVAFNTPDVGKQGAVYVTAWVPANGLGALGLLTAPLNHAMSVTITRDNPHLGGEVNSRQEALGTLLAATDPTTFVLIQRTPSGWALVVNGKLIPYASGVLGDAMSSLNILNNTDPSNLLGAQFCVGYGTSDTEMILSGRMLPVAIIPDANGNAATNGSCNIADVVVEFYNTNLDHYFITADSNEAAQIDNGSAGPGWSRTGNSFRSGGDTSVCRFYGSYSPGPNSHFYTVDSAECQGLKDQQIPAGDPRKLTSKSWNYESLDFVSTVPSGGACPTGTTPVYRAYNNGFARGVDSNHRITGSATAIQEVVTRGWSNEGVVMCAPN